MRTDIAKSKTVLIQFAIWMSIHARARNERVHYTKPLEHTYVENPSENAW